MSNLDHTSFLQGAVLQETFPGSCSLPAQANSPTVSGASRLGEAGEFLCFQHAVSSTVLSPLIKPPAQLPIRAERFPKLSKSREPAMQGRRRVRVMLSQPLGTTDTGNQSHQSAEPPMSDDITAVWGEAGTCSATLGEMNPAPCPTPCAHSHSTQRAAEGNAGHGVSLRYLTPRKI